MSESDQFSSRIAELSQTLLSDECIDGFLARVARLSVALIPACDTCSVSVVADGKVRTRASSDGLSERVDQHQYDQGEGPCLQAIETGASVGTVLLAEETRWPGFVTLAAAEGVAGCYSVPLRAAERTVGALNLYSLTRPFGDGDQEVSESFAGHAAVAVANADAYHQALELSRHLEEALKSRDLIGQAKGIIMERERLTADQAFDMLRKMSQAKNVKLREVAELVVLTGSWN
ncbi:MAG TPA: GAF and ANTAR domain-containing protein [Acidimicrobiales bacterium]|nr:GAF and ANTAR domain-containing protein [Acidimicrobiales bacterium]